MLSMGAWALLFVAFLGWAWLGLGWSAKLRALGRIALLTLAAGSVLFGYFVRSKTLDAGVHVDAAYSYIGLTWFTELNNPITFVAPNPSYVQLPLMELGHLPALAIGFDRLGAFSCLFGTMLQVAVLLAVMTTIFVPQHLLAQILTVGLAAAVFSNRMLVLGYNNFGYTVPAICLGLMFLAVVDDESVPDPDRVVGGLLLVAALQHYSGLTQVLPLSLLWLVLRRGGLRRFPSFLARNPLLLAAAAMCLITVAIDPGPFALRLRDVTVGIGQAPPQPGAALVAKMQKNWAYLTSSFPHAYYHQLFIENGGSWPFLNIPPLGGLVVPLMAGGWLLAVWSMAGRRLRCLLYVVAFVLALLTLAIFQHLLTDFTDYRNLTPIIALLVTGLLFVFRAPRSGRVLQLVALCYAVAVAVFNYVDLANLHGKLHSTPDYAPFSQQTMEGLVRYLKHRSPTELGVTRIHVVLDSFFPLKPYYLKELARYGVPIEPIDEDQFCADQAGVLERASAAGCEPFLVVTHTKRCRGRDPAARTARVDGRLYGSICGSPTAGLPDRPVVPIAIDPGGGNSGV